MAAHKLRFIGGSLEGQTFDISSRVVLGRSAEADIQILDKGVSRQHCCILEDDSRQLVIVDLASSNGTWVNDDEILRKPLRPGARIRIGDVECVLEEGEGPSKAASQVKEASSIASDRTVLSSPLGCGSALHGRAIAEAWPYCPSCGAAVS